jgi:aminoglycoside phosphotransferase family enzyme
MEKVIRKVTFEESERLDEEFWRNKTPQERLKALTQLRMQYHGGMRLAKVITRAPYDR